ncbi:MAG: ATP-binding cassette domain-containing protein [Planctomycetia bacterium]|nr:ATP-binding cassette domain-containing protein [Planctomycetia bacterium]
MLEIQGIHKTFFPNTPNEVHSLRGVELTIADGSFVIVIGTNGSGKTTLLNAVAGTFFVDQGTIKLANQDVTHWPEQRRATLIGRVFQNPLSGTAANLTIAENLALASRRGLSRGLQHITSPARRAEIQERIRSLGMGLDDRLDNPIGTLSGGQRQALTLLMATWRRPHLLLLDEHTAALDPKSADQVIKVSEQVIARDKLTTMMVTHSMQQAANLGDRLIMMSRGKIVHDLSGPEKRRLRPEDLLARFDEIRRGEQLDDTAAQLLRRVYV